MRTTIFLVLFLISLLQVETGLCQGNIGRNWRRGTATVLFAGVGGGVLGLSTLSFYGKPQEHASNITLGGLLGVLGGLTYVLMNEDDQISQQQSQLLLVPDLEQKKGELGAHLNLLVRF